MGCLVRLICAFYLPLGLGLFIAIDRTENAAAEG
jgi:hypothetical protein